MKYFLLTIFLVAVILTAGCVADNKMSEITLVETPAATLSPVLTTVPPVTLEPAPPQTYKTADLVMRPNTRPECRFRMEYPSDWWYSPGYTSSWVTNEEYTAGYLFEQAGENVMYPRYFVQVHLLDRTGTEDVYEPLDTWANEIIRSLNMRHYYTLKSNDPVSIPGSLAARRLVLSTFPGGDIVTLYLAYSGEMQGYNSTVPGHRLPAVKVNGLTWDYAVGGQAYIVTLYARNDQVNNISGIFDHMANSFEITTTP